MELQYVNIVKRVVGPKMASQDVRYITPKVKDHRLLVRLLSKLNHRNQMIMKTRSVVEH